jgi:hypothetical protein
MQLLLRVALFIRDETSFNYDLTTTDISIIFLIASHIGINEFWFISQDEISRECRIKPRHFRDRSLHISKQGLLEIKRTSKANGYKLILPHIDGKSWCSDRHHSADQSRIKNESDRHHSAGVIGTTVPERSAPQCLHKYNDKEKQKEKEKRKKKSALKNSASFLPSSSFSEKHKLHKDLSTDKEIPMLERKKNEQSILQEDCNNFDQYKKNNNDLLSKENKKETLQIKEDQKMTNENLKETTVKDKITVKKNEQVRFDEFWQAYPRKDGKKNASKIWQRDKLDSKIDQIMNHLKERKDKNSWQNPLYIPMASTFLNGQRWEDEVISDQAQSTNYAKSAQRNEVRSTVTEWVPSRKLDQPKQDQLKQQTDVGLRTMSQIMQSLKGVRR